MPNEERFDLRSLLKVFSEQGELIVEDASTGIWEVSPRLWADSKTIMFNNIEGYDIPVLGNTCNSREKIATAMGCTAESLLWEYVKRAGNPHLPVLVSDGPVKGVKYTGEDVDLTRFPLLLQHEYDGAPYMSAAVDFCRNDKGGHNIGIRRLMFLSKNEITFNATSPSDLKALIAKSKSKGNTLELAFVIGAHPLVYIGALTRVPVDDEISLIGGLMERPLEVVRCETVDVLVPADAEMVIEGILHTDEMINEGPFGEVVGLYGEGKVNARMEITAITHRKDMIYNTLTASGETVWNTDSAHISAVRAELSVWNAMKQAVAKPVNAYSVPAAGGQLVVRASIEAQNEGDGKNALLAILSCLSNVKVATLCDAEVNIFDSSQVDHEIAMKVQPSEDVMIISNARAIAIDPSLSGRPLPFTGSKMGIDATASKKLPPGKFVHSKPPFSEEFLSKNKPSGCDPALQGEELETAVLKYLRESAPEKCRFLDIWGVFFASDYRDILLVISNLFQAGKLEKSREGCFIIKQ